MFQPVRATNHFLYKYKPFQPLDWTRQILLDHQLYFSSPDELHDPFDSRPMLRVRSRRSALSNIINPYFESHAWDDPRDLADAVAWVVRLIWFEPDRLEGLIRTLFIESQNCRRLYSMTTRPDNAHLWEHYAGNHTGYCLEFSNEGGIFGQAHHVIYTHDLELDFGDVNELMLFGKTRAYEVEEEVRIIGLPSTPHIVPFDPNLLRRVICGHSMTAQNNSLIRLWCATRVPPVPVDEEH